MGKSIYDAMQTHIAVKVAEKQLHEASYEILEHSALGLMGICVSVAGVVVLNYAAHLPLIAITVDPICASLLASAGVGMVGGGIASGFGTLAACDAVKYCKAKKFLKINASHNKSQKQDLEL